MPPEAQQVCTNHPNIEAVETCDACGRPLCLSCAVPVRGRVLGAECLGIDLVAPPAQRVGRLILPWAGAGFAIAVLATALPWRKYGLGSGLLGAWGLNVRWSVIAAVAAVAGLIAWAIPSLTRRLRRRGGWLASIRVLAVAAGSASAMALLHPPIVGPLSYGAWVAIAGCVLALSGSWGTLPPSD